jgi:hypothetical protein
VTQIFYIHFNHFAILYDCLKFIKNRHQPRGVRRLAATVIRHGVYNPTAMAHGDWWPSTAVGEPPRQLDL